VFSSGHFSGGTISHETGMEFGEGNKNLGI